MYVEVLQEIKDAFHFPLTKQTDIKTYLVYINEQNALFCRLLLIVQPVLDYCDDGVQKCQKIMVSQTTEHLFLTSIIIGFKVESIMIIKVNFTLKYYYDHYVPDIQGSAAHCMDLAQKSQKIVSKSCFNYTFSMIQTCEAVFVDNKSAVQV